MSGVKLSYYKNSNLKDESSFLVLKSHVIVVRLYADSISVTQYLYRLDCLEDWYVHNT